MPKINAPTVVEHRAARREALLRATRTLLSDPARTQTISIGEVAELAGMSRPAVYSYFASRDDLIQAAVHDAFPNWAVYVVETMSRASTPADRVLAYVDANLHLIACGQHTLIRALTATRESRRSGKLAHESIRIPLTSALTDLNVDDPPRVSELIQSLLFTVAPMIDTGMGEAEARSLVRGLITPYLDQAATAQSERRGVPGRPGGNLSGGQLGSRIEGRQRPE